MIEESIERILKLACFLGTAEVAVLHLEQPTGSWFQRGDQPLEVFRDQDLSFKFSLELEVGAAGDPRGTLRLFSSTSDFRAAREPLRTCADLLARTLKDSQSIDRYRNFLNETNEGVWRCELRRPMDTKLPVEEQVKFIFEHGFMAECNPALARMYGFENTDDVVGAPLAALLIPDDPRNHDYLASFVENGYRLRNGESVEKDRHGALRYFLNNLVGIVDESGVRGAWGTQTDITAFKDLEKKLTQTAEAAADANRAKSAFLANISHEIRTPLGVILGFADLALDKPDLTAETKGYISAIRRNGELVTELLGEVLDLSKIEARRMEVEEIRFPLVPLLTEVITFLDLHAREKGLELSLERSGRLPRVVCSDPTKLRQILTNLIGNAIKFTPSGHVRVSVRLLGEPAKGDPLRLEFTIRDSGIGIGKDQQKKLFQPYAQAESSTTRRFGGTGLGLSLSRHLARALGGDLVLSASDLGQGSTFCLTIAAGTFEGDWHTDGMTGTTGGWVAGDGERQLFKGKRILLVEDSEDNQVLIKHYLSTLGVDVDIANNGLEGLAKVTGGTYDLIVLDIQMPGMDGHECARTMRERGFVRPIIALTAHAFKEDRDKAFRNGFNEYLTKPINRAVFLRTLGQRLSSANSLH